MSLYLSVIVKITLAHFVTNSGSILFSASASPSSSLSSTDSKRPLQSNASYSTRPTLKSNQKPKVNETETTDSGGRATVSADKKDKTTKKKRNRY